MRDFEMYSHMISEKEKTKLIKFFSRGYNMNFFHKHLHLHILFTARYTVTITGTIVYRFVQYGKIFLINSIVSTVLD